MIMTGKLKRANFRIGNSFAESIRGISRRQWLAACGCTVLLALLCLASLLHKTMEEIAIGSAKDGTVELSAEQPALTQSWQSYVKAASGIRLYLCDSTEDAAGNQGGAVNEDAGEQSADVKVSDYSLKLTLTRDAAGENPIPRASADGIMGNDAADGLTTVEFAFPHAVKLQPGVRYYLQISLQDDTVTEREQSGLTVDADGSVITLAADEDNAGLSAGGAMLPGSLAGEVLYERTSNAAFLLQLVLILTGFSGFLALLLNHRSEETLPVSFGIIFLLLYVCGISGSLSAGAELVRSIGMILALSLPFALLISTNRDRCGIRTNSVCDPADASAAEPVLQGMPVSRKTGNSTGKAFVSRLSGQIVTPGFVLFWLLAAAYFVLDRNTVTGKVDDLTHWGLCVRDMWYWDQYPMHKYSNVILPGYVPGMATIEYFFLYLFGALREGIMVLAANVTGFAYLILLTRNITWRKCLNILPAAVLILILPPALFMDHYMMLYVDAYVGIIGAYCFLVWFTGEHDGFQLLQLLFGTIFLVQIKDFGLVTAAGFWLCVLLDLWIHDASGSWTRLWKSPFTWKSFVSSVVSLGGYGVWSLYLSAHGSGGRVQELLRQIRRQRRAAAHKVSLYESLAVPRESGIVASLENPFHALADLPSKAAASLSGSSGMLLTGKITQNPYTGPVADTSAPVVLKAMAHYLVAEKELMGEYSYLEILLAALALCLLPAAVGLYHRAGIRLRAVLTSLLIGTATYMSALAFVYFYVFADASPIPAAKRYMGSYLLLTVLVLFGILFLSLTGLRENARWSVCAAFCPAILAAFVMPGTHPLYQTAENRNQYAQTYEVHSSIGETFRSFSDRTEKVFFISYQDSDLVPKYNYLTFRNAIVPTGVQGLTEPWKPIAEYEEQYRTFAEIVNPGQLARQLTQYDYVYIHDADAYFTEHYGMLFEDPEEIVNGGVYQVLCYGEPVSGDPAVSKNAVNAYNSIDEAGNLNGVTYAGGDAVTLRRIAVKDLN